MAEDHEELADELEKQASDMETQRDQHEQKTEDARATWRQRQGDESVPGADDGDPAEEIEGGTGPKAIRAEIEEQDDDSDDEDSSDDEDDTSDDENDTSDDENDTSDDEDSS